MSQGLDSDVVGSLYYRSLTAILSLIPKEMIVCMWENRVSHVTRIVMVVILTDSIMDHGTDGYLAIAFFQEPTLG